MQPKGTPAHRMRRKSPAGRHQFGSMGRMLSAGSWLQPNGKRKRRGIRGGKRSSDGIAKKKSAHPLRGQISADGSAQDAFNVTSQALTINASTACFSAAQHCTCSSLTSCSSTNFSIGAEASRVTAQLPSHAGHGCSMGLYSQFWAVGEGDGGHVSLLCVLMQAHERALNMRVACVHVTAALASRFGLLSPPARCARPHPNSPSPSLCTCPSPSHRLLSLPVLPPSLPLPPSLSHSLSLTLSHNSRRSTRLAMRALLKRRRRGWRWKSRCGRLRSSRCRGESDLCTVDVVEEAKHVAPAL
eukprot:6213264-Pleurochrysis_carterae.AAC.2